ncbi:DUF3782 domain-containing protein [Hydrogenobacter sp. T-2]|uniref:PD-(D/E)XK nuclease family protein n=1 Tax=Pampinifervens diazotrophicum TaxID=1632018 RepID=UPI002B258CBE|nr:DUF3782 domain-containing protein [Hydrogenobacter sp. T-2]WPM32996.1 DUF3782 domain-containing protein [Hydrogenobacter sp. T-2]
MAKRVFVEKAKRFLRKVLQEPELREYVVKELSTHFADKEKTEDNIERLYRELVRIGDELVRLREEQERKWQEQSSLWQEQNKRWEEQNKRWEEQNKRWEEQDRRWEEQRKLWEEQNKRWEEQNRRWEEQQKINRELMEEIKKLHRKYDTGIGALGARWGLRAESSFREAIKGILEEDFPVKVERYLAYDQEGEVFGRPDQVELDLIIRDGKTLIAEIKSSMSKSDVFVLKRKVEFYKKREGKEVDRVLIISPMVDSKAMNLAKEYGFEVYSYPEDVEGLNEEQ